METKQLEASKVSGVASMLPRLLLLPFAPCYLLLLPIAPSVSCLCVDAPTTPGGKLRSNPPVFHRLPLSPAFYNPSKFTPRPPFQARQGAAGGAAREGRRGGDAGAQLSAGG